MSSFDPITLSLLYVPLPSPPEFLGAEKTDGMGDSSNRFMSIAEAMGRALQQTSISTNIKVR